MSSHHPKLALSSLAIASIAVTGLLVAPVPSASAHGNVGGPASSLTSRAAMTANANRGTVQNEPQSLEAPKGFPAAGPADGKLASAGGLFGGNLDEQSATRWAKNVVQAGPVKIAWALTAAHRTAKWSYYITKVGWDQNDELERSDFELLASFDGGGGIPDMTTVHTLNIPADHTGYHVIYAVWDIADTANAFYNTIDLDVRSAGSTTPGTPVTPANPVAPPVTPTNPVTPPVTPVNPVTPPAPVTAPPAAPGAPSGVHTMARTQNSIDLMWSGGSSADSYRVERSTDGTTFTTAGTSTSKRYLDSGLAAGTTYRYRIVAVSAAGETASAVFTTTTTAAVTPTSPTSPSKPTSPASPTTPNQGVAAWNATGTYVRGDLRQHNGVVYRAVQSHRAWGDPSWITAASLWTPVRAAN